MDLEEKFPAKGMVLNFLNLIFFKSRSYKDSFSLCGVCNAYSHLSNLLKVNNGR